MAPLHCVRGARRAAAACASGRAAGRPSRAASVGSWTVDLRPTPGSAPYLKTQVITAVDGTRIEGHFYDGGPLLHFAFFTDPGEGAYQSAGRQVAPDRLEGMTLSTTRGFLLPWTAVRDTVPAASPDAGPGHQVAPSEGR